MKILYSSVLNKFPIGRLQGAAVPFAGLRMNSPLKSDSAVFSQAASSIKAVREALEQEDNLKALKLMGLDAQIDEHGGITINGSVDFVSALGLDPDMKPSLTAAGIDSGQLMKNVRRINGDLVLDGADIRELDKNLEVSGTVLYSSGGHHYFNNFASEKDISSMFLNTPQNPHSRFNRLYAKPLLSPAAVRTFADAGVLPPSMKTKQGAYFFNIDKPECREFIETLKRDMPNLYNFSALKSIYGLAGKDVQQEILKGNIEIYGLTPDVSDKNFKALNYLYKIINPLPQTDEARIRQFNLPEIYSALERNAIDCPEVYGDGTSVPASALKALGYGSRADIAANTGLTSNDYYVKKYILENDVYDITSGEMRLALDNARKNNPALINPAAKAPSQIRNALINDRLKTVFDAYSPHKDFLIDISAKDNLKFLKTIDNADFQRWLDSRLAAYKKYKADNLKKMQEFKQLELTDDAQVRQNFQARINEMDMRRKREAGKSSLKMKTAWAVCPETRKIMQQNFNPHIKELLNKNRAAVNINKMLLEGEMTYEEAASALKKLSFSEKEEKEILAYYKKCWEASGSEEWKKGLQIGKETAEAYIEYGLEGIEDETLRRIAEKWEIEFFTRRRR